MILAVTLKDIAQECGLAVSTVSNILNNNSTSFASEAARKRVRDTAERLGYKRDYLSSSLRTRKTKSVGLILDQIVDFTRQDFLVPFVEKFSAQGYEVALAEHRHDPHRAVDALEGFASRYKDGVVLFSDLLRRPDHDQAILKRAVEVSKVKILAIGSRMRELVPSVEIDRGRAVERSLDHFVAQGHQKILVVYEYDWDMRPRFSQWDRPGITYWGGIHEFEDFVARMGPRPFEFSAVFFRTDRIAIPALKYFSSRGIRVPQDVEVIGFDNFPFAAQTTPALSTWDIGFHRVGERAQGLLGDWMAGGNTNREFYELYQPDFVARESHRGNL